MKQFAMLVMLILAGDLAHAQTPRGEPRDVPSLSAMEGGPGSHVIDIGAVPETVVASARDAVDGIALTSASWFHGDDSRVYRLNGSRFNRKYAVFVRNDGRVLRVDSDDWGD